MTRRHDTCGIHPCISYFQFTEYILIAYKSDCLGGGGGGGVRLKQTGELSIACCLFDYRLFLVPYFKKVVLYSLSDLLKIYIFTAFLCNMMSIMAERKGEYLFVYFCLWHKFNLCLRVPVVRLNKVNTAAHTLSVIKNLFFSTANAVSLAMMYEFIMVISTLTI